VIVIYFHAGIFNSLHKYYFDMAAFVNGTLAAPPSKPGGKHSKLPKELQSLRSYIAKDFYELAPSRTIGGKE
jgi:hypothetical protein